MADITLAECGGAAWLVGGEALIDDFLANELGPETTIEIISCDNKSAVLALWAAHGGARAGADPWLIHPAILARARGGVGGGAVVFPAWSALLDEAAMGAIEAAARRAVVEGDVAVELVDYLEPGGQDGMEDLARVRLAVIQARLEQAGVARGRIVRSRGEWAAEASGRVDIVVRARKEEEGSVLF